MLRLTRDNQSGEIAIGLRSGERFLSRPFLLALTIAIALHAGPLVLFRLRPRQGAALQPLVPTLVLATPQQPIAQPLAAAREPVAPAAAMPTLPAPPTVSAPITIATTCQLSPIEAPATDTSFSPPPLADLFVTAYRPITLKCEGDLAALPIRSSPHMPEEQTISPRVPLHRYTLRYRVKVEGPSGQVLLVRPETTTGIAAIDNRAHGFVRSLRFVPTSELFIAAGVIEVTVQSPQPQWPT